MNVLISRREGIKMMGLPPLREWSGGQLKLGDIHEFDVTDLLGRTPIKTDLTSIAGYVRGKVILITGAGGSIGSEIASQVHQFGPKELVCLDRDESALHSVQLSIYGKALLDTPDMVLCDIRDKDALQKIFDVHRPQVVFHAAALKHLTLPEQYPEEGWKTNVHGTLDVLECAAEFGVDTFVNISTDMAADPTRVLGKTKRRAEELTTWFAETHEGHYLSVRFGNVLGSRGSVLHTFAQQIDRGGPVTVVHPDVTRFFMTIPEACQLVIQAGAIGRGGQVLVLNMGEPVRILDMANRLIQDSGKEIEVSITGLREGEKLHEVLFGGTEDSSASEHPHISCVRVPARNPGNAMPVEAAAENHREAGSDSARVATKTDQISGMNSRFRSATPLDRHAAGEAVRGTGADWQSPIDTKLDALRGLGACVGNSIYPRNSGSRIFAPHERITTTKLKQ